MKSQSTIREDSTSGGGKTHNDLALQPRSVLSIDTHKRGRKRTRDKIEENTGTGRSHKGLRLNDTGFEPSYDPRGFACPFFKANHRKFDLKDSCARRSWPSIPRLKEHLYRCHVTISCERCRTPFKSHRELVAHKRQATSCRRTTSEDRTSESFICSSKMNELKSRKDLPRHNDREKWMRIWTILFPDSPSPESPYADHIDDMRLNPDFMQDFEGFLNNHIPALTESITALDRDTLGETGHLRDVVSDWLSNAFQQYREKLGFDHSRSARTMMPARGSEGSLAESPGSTSFEESWESSPMLSSIRGNPPTTTRGLYGTNGNLAGNGAEPLSDAYWASSYVLPPTKAMMGIESDAEYDYRPQAWFNSACECPVWTNIPPPNEQSSILSLQRGTEFTVGHTNTGFTAAPTSASAADFDVMNSTWMQPLYRTSYQSP